MQEFSDQATGVGVTFKPTIIGFGAMLDNLSAFLDDTTRPMVIVGAASAYIVLWLFVAGGILDRYARDRATGRTDFSRRAACSSSGSCASRWCNGRSMRFSSRTCTGGCSTRLSADHARDDRRADGFFRSRGALRRVRRPAGRVGDRVRLREGPRRRGRSPQHARRTRRRAGLHPAQHRRGHRAVPREFRDVPRVVALYASSRQAPAAAARRCGSASRSDSCTFSAGCG